MDTTRPIRAPSWLRRERGGAILTGFQFISKTMADEMATVASVGFIPARVLISTRVRHRRHFVCRGLTYRLLIR